ncbi:MAG: amidase [Chloroflexi bacterium]|nr:amidase [Chloroflexota bacterium]
MPDGPIPTTIHQARRLLAASEVRAVELAQACLDQIGLDNPRLNAFIHVAGGDALHEEAAAIPGRPLSGIPVAVKDIIDQAGLPTTAGSTFFGGQPAGNDAAVVERLKSAGAFIVGRTNLHEIALGVTNVNPHFGACRNPRDPQRISGGSSGGSAVAVAAGMCLAALGTDTGGSIRIPAALCGVAGLKPTYGRVSLRGVMPLSWNLDHVGPLARTARDLALALQAIAGYDALDPASVDLPPQDYPSLLGGGVRGWKMAMAVGDYIEESDADVLAAVREAGRVFKGLGASVVEMEVPGLQRAALANGQMVQADAAAFHRERLASNPERFGDDVRLRLQAGAALTAVDYALARRVQAEEKRWFDGFFSEFDLLLLPTTPIPAPLIEGTDALEQARRLTRFTAPFNLAGLPALSIPCGENAEGLPLGLQLAARPWAEAAILRAAFSYEREMGRDRG